MRITKVIREYAEQVIGEKYNNLVEAELTKTFDAFEKLSPQLDKIESEAHEKCRKLIASKGLVPEEFGYYKYSPRVPRHNPYRFNGRMIQRSRNRSGVYLDDNAKNIVRRCLAQIELGAIPKNDVMSFIDNYEVVLGKTE